MAVTWIIGLAGSGKTTTGKALRDRLVESGVPTVFLDGDVIRGLFGANDKASYTVAGRKENSERFFQLCKLLDDSKINVVCAILSIFEEHRKRNREVFEDYYEVYLSADMESLMKRRPLYNMAIEGLEKNVVGVDIEFEEPKSPDLHFATGISGQTTEKIVDSIVGLYLHCSTMIELLETRLHLTSLSSQVPYPCHFSILRL